MIPVLIARFCLRYNETVMDKESSIRADYRLKQLLDARLYHYLASYLSIDRATSKTL